MKRIISLFIITICFFSGTYAQESGSLNRELTLEKEYNPSIRDANKINSLPELKAPAAPKSNVEYSSYLSSYSLSPYLIIFPAESYFNDLKASNKRGYVNLGLSTRLDVNGDLGYQIINTKEDYLSIYASNRYTNNSVSFLQTDEQKNRMKMNDILAGVNYRHDFKNAIFDLGMQYTYSKSNFYGLSPYYKSDVLSLNGREDLKLYHNHDEIYTPDIKNNIFEANTGIRSDASSDLNYSFNLAYSRVGFNSIYDYVNDRQAENRILANLNLNKEINSTWSIGFEGGVRTFFYSEKESTATIYVNNPLSGNVWNKYDNYAIIDLNPYFTTGGAKWNARLGINIDMQLGGFNKINVSPDVHFSFTPSSVFRVYVDAKGGIRENSRYALFNTNRYLTPNERVLDTRIPLDATVGMKISPISSLVFDLHAGYAILRDEMFVNPSSISLNSGGVVWGVPEEFLFRQQIIAISDNVNQFNLGASIDYKYKDIFSMNIAGEYYGREFKAKSTVSPREAWGKPNFIGTVNLGYKFPEIPFRLNLDYRLEAGRKSYINSQIVNMKDIHDLSVRGVYEINDMISTNLSVNNLLFQKYDIWYGYPAQNFNIMGGISLKF